MDGAQRGSWLARRAPCLPLCAAERLCSPQEAPAGVCGAALGWVWPHTVAGLLLARRRRRRRTPLSASAPPLQPLVHAPAHRPLLCAGHRLLPAPSSPLEAPCRPAQPTSLPCSSACVAAAAAAAAASYGRLAKQSPEHCAAIFNAGGVQALCQLLASNSSLSVVDSACGALCGVMAACGGPACEAAVRRWRCAGAGRLDAPRQQRGWDARRCQCLGGCGQGCRQLCGCSPGGRRTAPVAARFGCAPRP